jgi:ankyrin repeat protein
MDTTHAISLHQHLQVSLDHGADIHASIDQGFTTIHLATGSCNLELVSLLLANAADVNARVSREEHSGGFNAGPTITVESNTPLHLAIGSAHGASIG